MNKRLVSILLLPLLLGTSLNVTHAMKMSAKPIAKMVGGVAGNEIPQCPFAPFDKQKLIDHIRNDIYKIYQQEMAIINKDWLSIAQGNTALERDLKELYQNFSSDIDSTQEKLNEFCQTWKLDAITIY